MSRNLHGGKLLLLGSGDRLYRGYALIELARRFDILLVTPDADYEWPHGADGETLVADPRNWEEVLLRIAHTDHQIRGVFTYDEFCVESAAHIAMKMGLPGNSPETAARCRDKALMRSTLEAHNLQSPTSIEVSTPEEAELASIKTGYPLVVKPAALAGSIGVVRVDSPSELRHAVAQAIHGISSNLGHAPTPRLLIEEFVDGPEISVESIVRNGSVEIVSVTRKQLGAAPYFEETGHYVSPSEPIHDQAAILDAVQRTHTALDLHWGATHTELRITPQGPYVIEIAARAGGDFIPLITRLTTGKDQIVEAAAAIMGSAEPGRGTPLSAAAAIRFFYPSDDLEFQSIQLNMPTKPHWLYHFSAEVPSGTRLLRPPNAYLDRAGFAIVLGANLDQCRERVAELDGVVDIVGA